MESAELTYMAQQQNDRIDETVRKERRRLFSFIRGRVRNDAEAEDVMQDVFTQLVEASRGLQQIEKVGSWLFRVARNKIADLYRKQKPAAEADLSEVDAPMLLDILPDLSTSPDEALMQEMIWEAIQEALEDLPPAQREVFTLHEFDGMRFREISELTGESENTLRMRKYHAVQTLRTQLESLYEEL